MSKKKKFVRINTISWPFPRKRKRGRDEENTEADKSNPFYCAHRNEEQNKSVRFLSVSQHEQEKLTFSSMKIAHLKQRRFSLGLREEEICSKRENIL